MAAKVVKKRNWAFVLYPESAPDDWRDRLTQTGLPCCISPLHDRDLNPNGEPKKSHHHVMLFYAGPTSFDVVRRLCDSLNQPIPQAVEAVKGYYRYLTHQDNPEKAQYDPADIETLNGFNTADYFELSNSELTAVYKRIQQFIREADIFEYSDLLDALLDNGALEDYAVASRNTVLFNTYITSRRNKAKGSVE